MLCSGRDTAFADEISRTRAATAGRIISVHFMTSPRTFLASLGFVLIVPASPPSAHAQAPPREITIDANAAAHPFPHFWEVMFGSGRAILALRDNYRRDLQDVHDQVGLRYVRFHAILHDEVGLYDETDSGTPIYNFTYVDEIYDGLLERSEESAPSSR